MAKIRLTDGQELDHEDDSQPLIQSLQQHGFYSECRSGYCGACKITLQSGSVRYIKTPMAYLKPNQILPCCCVPESDLALASP